MIGFIYSNKKDGFVDLIEFDCFCLEILFILEYYKRKEIFVFLMYWGNMCLRGEFLN